MNRSLAIVSAFALVLFAGCAAPQDAEEVSESGDASESALEAMVDEPAEVPAEGAKPKIETVDLSGLSGLNFDLSSIRDSRTGNPDFSRLQLDVLDTGRRDNTYGPTMNSRDLNLKWVESDRHELPAFVDKIAHGVDVGGGKCRIKNLSLKKIVVGCKWTW